ncbi:hypothetical protein EI012_25495, partial [Escherichia coli]|nr:hypothetical protein [Escherichia coli]
MLQHMTTAFAPPRMQRMLPITLNGIDFDIEKTELYWDDLARELDTLRQPNKKFYLSAAPQCPTEPKIYYLGQAIKTGLFDYIFVQFYNNPVCSYSSSSGSTPLLESWDKWTSLVPSNNTLFVGLPAGPDAATNGGYIPPEVVNSQVL